MVNSEKLISIVIAEDDEDDYLLTMEAFKEAGVENEVSWVKDGEELLKLLRSNEGRERSSKPGLILLDLNMPKKDGREALSDIKSDPKIRHIPVIVLTTSKAEADIANSYNLGVNSFIEKPSRFQEFVNVIKVFSDYWLNTVTLPLSLPVAGHERGTGKILLVEDDDDDEFYIRCMSSNKSGPKGL